MRPTMRRQLLYAVSASASLIGITGYPLMKRTNSKSPVESSSIRDFFREFTTVPEVEYIEIPLGTDDLTKELPTPDGVNSMNEVPINYSHWVLLSMMKSDRPDRRTQAINELARQRRWNDAECRVIAQALDRVDMIRLARTSDCDGRLFLPPPTLSFLEQSLKSQRIEKMIKSILKDVALSSDECSSCTNFYTNRSIRNRPNPTILAINEINQVEVLSGIDPRQRRNRSALDEDIIKLKAILSNCTCGERQSLTMITSGLMMALHHFRYRYPNNKDVKALISQILAQLSVHETTRNHMFEFGWIKVLFDYSRDSHLEICLPAYKALANLDKDSHVTYGDLIYLLAPLTRNDTKVDQPKFDVIFVHGLVGSVYKTWRQSYEMLETDPSWTRCWPKDWLAQDIGNLRILAVEYPTALSNWRTDCNQDKHTLAQRGRQVMQQLVAAGVGERPIIWVAHSMGGLLVKQMLLNSHGNSQSDDNNESEYAQSNDDDSGVNETSNLDQVKIPDRRFFKLIDQTKGVVFYSVPHKGSNLEWIERKNLQKVLMLTTEVIELQKGSSILLKLHEQFMDLISTKHTNIRFLTFTETLISRFGVGSVQWKGTLVHEDSLQFDVGPTHQMQVDHANTCKPMTRETISYANTREFIRDIINDNMPRENQNSEENWMAFLTFPS